jgi:hypothetical protein
MITLDSVHQFIDWADPFRVWGIIEYHPAWTHAGIPNHFCADPNPLVTAALHFWSTEWEGITWNGRRVGAGYSDPGFPENYRLGIESLLRETFSRISKSYGEKPASDLHQWAVRNFLDHKQRGLWHTWSSLFRLAARGATIPFTPSNGKLIQRSINEHFGARSQEAEEQLFDGLREIPLSKIARRIVALEVTQPTDFPEVDIIQILEHATLYEHAYRLWLELDEQLSDADREILLWWAYEQGAEMGISAMDIELPSRRV